MGITYRMASSWQLTVLLYKNMHKHFFCIFFCLKKLTFARFVAKRYILQQKCLNGQMGTCLIVLGTRWYNF